MVDFNNQTTVTTSPDNIVKILFLQKREYLSDAWEQFYKEEYSTDRGERLMPIIMARTQTLLQELKPQLKRTNLDLIKLQADIIKDKAKLEEIRDTLYSYLDDINLTRIDSKPKYDRTSLEEDNKQAGL